MPARLVQVLFRFCGTDDTTLTRKVVANQADTTVQQGPLWASSMWESTRWLVSGAIPPSPPECGHGKPMGGASAAALPKPITYTGMYLHLCEARSTRRDDGNELALEQLVLHGSGKVHGCALCLMHRTSAAA